MLQGRERIIQGENADDGNEMKFIMGDDHNNEE